MVTAGTVTSKLHIQTLVYIQICIHIPLVCSPDSSGHAWPRLLECKHALNIISVDFLAGDGINDGWLNAEEGE